MEPIDPSIVSESNPIVRSRLRTWIVVAGCFFAATFAGVWLLFHTLPWQSSFRRMLDDAEIVEIFRMKGNRPVRWVRLENPEEWRGLGPAIVFKNRFWQFCHPPEDAIVVQVIRQRRRFGAWDVRDDGCLHIRKGARWYQMPADGAFEKQVRELLAKRGVDLPPDSPTAPTVPFPFLD